MVGLSNKVMLLPNRIAIPWLKKDPIATPNNILYTLVLEEKDNTKSCVLSPKFTHKNHGKRN